MFTGRNVARGAMLVALLGFVFPWVLVSCSGQPVGHLTGIDLATGGLTLPDSAGDTLRRENPGPNLWVIASLAAVIAGMAVSFVASRRRAILGLGACAVVALAASGIGVASASSEAPAAALRPQPDAGAASSDASGSGLVQVQLQYGYFITLAGLLTAIGACGVALAGREGGVG